MDSANLPTLAGTEIGCYVAYAIGIAILLLRLYTRAYVTHSLGLDDIFIIGGALASTAIIVTVRFMYKLGIGRHINTLTEYEVLYGRQVTWISLIFYNFSLGLIKTSIVALYLRLTTAPAHRMVLYIVGALVLSHGITASIVTSQVCRPVSVIWSTSFPRGCVNLIALSYFNAGFNALSDIVLAILPIPVLFRLNLPRSKKLGLSIVFGVGILTIVATMNRQVSYFRALRTRDFSYAWARTELLTIIEINMAILFACVPAIQTLFNTCCRSQRFQPFTPSSHDPSTDPSYADSSATNAKGRGWWAGRRIDRSESVREITGSDGDSAEGDRSSRRSTVSQPQPQPLQSMPELHREESESSASSSGGEFIIQGTDHSGERGAGRQDDESQSLESGVSGVVGGWKGGQLQSVSAGRGSKVLVQGMEVIPLRNWSIIAGSEVGSAASGGSWNGVTKSVDYRVEYS